MNAMNPAVLTGPNGSLWQSATRLAAPATAPAASASATAWTTAESAAATAAAFTLRPGFVHHKGAPLHVATVAGFDQSLCLALVVNNDKSESPGHSGEPVADNADFIHYQTGAGENLLQFRLSGIVRKVPYKDLHRTLSPRHYWLKADRSRGAGGLRGG
jgi:hypothetical protein